MLIEECPITVCSRLGDQPRYRDEQGGRRVPQHVEAVAGVVHDWLALVVRFARNRR